MSAPLYDVMLVAHILAAIVGFGAIAICGLEARLGRRSEDPLSDEGLVRFFQPGIDWPARAIYLIPLLGLGLLFGGDRAAASRPWPWIGLGLWLAATGVASGKCWPSERAAQRALAAAAATGAGTAPARDAELESFRRSCASVERGVALTSLCFVAAVAVMIAQPG